MDGFVGYDFEHARKNWTNKLDGLFCQGKQMDEKIGRDSESPELKNWTGFCALTLKKWTENCTTQLKKNDGILCAQTETWTGFWAPPSGSAFGRLGCGRICSPLEPTSI